MKQFIRFKCWGKETAPLRAYRRARRLKNIKSLSNARSFAKKIVSESDKEAFDALVTDILMMANKYEFNGDEYIYYHFKDKPLDERLSFVNDLEHVDFAENINRARNLYIFEDKGETYKRFREYYKRDVVSIYSFRSGSGAKLCEFAKKYGKIIIKPLSGTCGHGIQIVNYNTLSNPSDYFDGIVKEYCKSIDGGLVAEELLKQVPELEKFHPSSLNTLRITTIRFDDHVEVFNPFIRFGRGGGVVDNAGSGGLICDVDIESGKIVAVADEYGDIYSAHPDTGLEIIGFTIPQWEEAKSLAKELAMVVPSNRYAGWDIALTPDKGWVLIEGNARAQFNVWQIPMQKGFRKQANEILGALNKPLLKKYSSKK